VSDMPRLKVGNRKHYHTYLDVALINALHAVAKAKNTTAAELIREACRDYLFANAGRIIAETKVIEEMKP
jgi:hypothetical protein